MIFHSNPSLKLRWFIVSLLLCLFSCDSSENSSSGSNPLPSLQHLRDASKDLRLSPPKFISASDQIQLAYRAYRPESPKAVLIFYHGGGAYSGAGYPLVGEELSQEHEITVYLPDLRGHGDSQGDRGDAPNPEQVWRDVKTFVQLARSHFPKLPIFLGGHSSGGGMVLNYSSWEDREPVKGYVFLAPQLGFRSDTARTDAEGSFVSVTVPFFILNSMSLRLLCGHCHAVQFHYPADIDSKMVRSNTVNMANSLTPTNPQEQFERLDRPFGMWVGENDRLFFPKKVVAFANLATQVQQNSVAQILPGEEHLSILIHAHQTIGPWILQQIKN